MTRRTHVILTIAVAGGTAIVMAAIVLVQWRARWPLDAAWMALTIGLVCPLIVGYYALWRADAPRERLERGCIYLFITTYMGVTSAMLLVLEALTRTR